MIIDFHTHIFPDKVADGAVSALAKACDIPPYADGKKQGLLDALAQAGADIAINLPVVTNPMQFDSIARFALNLNAHFEGKGVLSFAGMHPKMDDVKGKMRFLRENGIKGIKLHPDYQSNFHRSHRRPCSASQRFCYRQTGFAVERRLGLLFHASRSCQSGNYP